MDEIRAYLKKEWEYTLKHRSNGAKGILGGIYALIRHPHRVIKLAHFGAMILMKHGIHFERDASETEPKE